MATPLTAIKFHSTLADGSDNAGGLLNTFLANTTTRVATYTTAALDVENTNPVVLDSTGRASVWLDPAVAYKFSVTDSAGVATPDGTVTGWTDGAGAILANLASHTGAANGPGMVGFNPALNYADGTVGAALVVRFDDFAGVDPAGVADSTTGMQAAITATSGRIVGSPGSTYKVSATLTLHSNIDIDLQGATVNWAGAVVTSSNKASKWDNAVFRCGTVAPGAEYTNIKVRNGTIATHNWGCGVFLKRVIGCEVSDLFISQANAAGITLQDCVNFSVTRNKLTDCAADPAQGFTASTDLEAWSDGILIFYGCQAGEVSFNSVVNTRTGTGRAGISVDDALAGSVESSRKTAAVTVRNNYVKGYDRQVHVEYSYATSVRDNFLEFVSAGSKTYNTVIIDWNTTDTLWENNRILSTKALMMSSGSVNCNIQGGSMIKTGGDTTNAFANQDAILSNVKFRSVNIALGASPSNIYRWNTLFEDCGISSTAYLRCSHYESTSKFIACTFTLASMWSTNSGLSTDSLDFLDCKFIGFATTNYICTVTSGSLFIRGAKLEAGDVRVYATGDVRFADMGVNTLPTVDGSPTKTSLDGIYIGSAKPTTQAWVKGDLMRNTNPAPGGTPFFQCTTSGTPGTWKSHAVMES